MKTDHVKMCDYRFSTMLRILDVAVDATSTRAQAYGRTSYKNINTASIIFIFGVRKLQTSGRMSGHIEVIIELPHFTDQLMRREV